MQRCRFRYAALAASCAATVLVVWNTPAVVTADAVHVDWPTISYDLARTGYNPNESTLGVKNVSRLKEIWSFTADGVIDTSPVVAANLVVVAGEDPVDLVYAGSEHGTFYAINTKTGKALWQKSLGSVQTTCDDLPGGVFGITSAPVIDRGSNRIYVAGGDGKVHALDLVTGAEAAGWPITVVDDTSLEHIWSGLSLSGSRLYAETASYCDFTPYHGRVVEIDVAAAALLATFYVTGGPTGPDGGGIWGWAGASIGGGGDVFVATGNALPDSIQTYLYAEDVTRLTPNLSVVSTHQPSLIGPDVDFGATPVLYQRSGCPAQLAVENKSGVLLVYDQGNIAAGPVQRLQVADVNDWQFMSNPSWLPGANTLFVANSSDSNSAVAPAAPAPGPYKHGMIAFTVGADCRLSLKWQTTIGPNPGVVSPSVVANGVVYYGDGSGNSVIAFDASTGAVLWSKRLGGAVYAEPIVVNGRVFAGSWDQKLHAFSLSN